jgi:hypothetical protein
MKRIVALAGAAALVLAGAGTALASGSARPSPGSSSEITVRRAPATLPQSATENLYVVSGGAVLILGIVGHVTADISAPASFGPQCNLTAGTYTSPPFGETSEAAGLYFGGGTIAQPGAGERSTEAVHPLLFDGPLFMPSGAHVHLACGGNRSGEMEWVLWYRPLDQGAAVTP